MKKLIILPFAILVICSLLTPYLPEARCDNLRSLDGKEWKEIAAVDPDGFNRALLIRGFYEGVAWADVEDYDKFHPTGMNYGNIVEALNQFYSDYKNINVYLGFALQIVTFEIQGADRSTVEKALMGYRFLSTISPEEFAESIKQNAEDRVKVQKEVEEFASQHEDFEELQPIMYEISLDLKNKDLTLQELYDKAKERAR